MNRKKRKLNFIRLKNAVRRGHAFYVQTKISWMAMSDQTFVHSEAAHWQKHWSRVYRLPLDLARIDIHITATDVIQETMTIQFVYRSLPYIEKFIEINNYTSYVNKRKVITRDSVSTGRTLHDNVGILRWQSLFPTKALEIPGLEFGSAYPFMQSRKAGGDTDEPREVSLPMGD